MRDWSRGAYNTQCGMEPLLKRFGNPIEKNDLYAQMQVDLSPYVGNVKELSEPLILDSRISEYAFFLRAQGEENAFEAFNELFSIWSRAKDLSQATFEEKLRAHFLHIRKAIAEYSDAFHLERFKADKPDPLCVKIALSETGQLIENAVAPFVRLFLDLYHMSDPMANASSVENLSLGKVIEGLSAHPHLKTLLFPSPWDIPLNQWRNIAHHNSFAYQKRTDEVLCRYGKPPKEKEFSFPYCQIHDLCRETNSVYMLLKTAESIFCIGETACSELMKTCELSLQSLAPLMVEILRCNNFEVTHLNLDTNPWELYMVDCENRSKLELQYFLARFEEFTKLKKGSLIEVVIKLKASEEYYSGILGQPQT